MKRIDNVQVICETEREEQDIILETMTMTMNGHEFYKDIVRELFEDNDILVRKCFDSRFKYKRCLVELPKHGFKVYFY